MRTRSLVLASVLVSAIAPVGLAAPGAAHAAPAMCRGEVATIVGTEGNDVLEGTSARDVIAGLGGNDRILGGDGDDLICGGDGADRLFGEAGDDVLLAGRAKKYDTRSGSGYIPDRLDGGPGDDLLDIGLEPTDRGLGISGEIRFASAPGGMSVDLTAGTATGDGNDTIVPRGGLRLIGTDAADVLIGSDYPEELLGLGGPDRLEGRGGEDRLYGDAEGAVEGAPGAEDDVLLGGADKDVVVGTTGSDRLEGGRGLDLVQGSGLGAQQVFGGPGADFLLVVSSGAPGQVVNGGPGRDDVTVDVPPSARGAARRITVDLGDLTSYRGIERLHAGERVTHLTYTGTPGPDVLYASSRSRLDASTLGGDDLVWGSRRSDTIDAGAGTDEVRGDLGQDTCIDAELVRSCEILSP